MWNALVISFKATGARVICLIFGLSFLSPVALFPSASGRTESVNVFVRVDSRTHGAPSVCVQTNRMNPTGPEQLMGGRRNDTNSIFICHSHAPNFCLYLHISLQLRPRLRALSTHRWVSKLICNICVELFCTFQLNDANNRDCTLETFKCSLKLHNFNIIWKNEHKIASCFG